MTLLMTMMKEDGVYMSTDYRVTNSRTHRVIDDAAVKFLHIRHPPDDESGARTLIGYTGLAILPDRTPMGTWLRETLRGEAEPFDVAMAHLHKRLERDIVPVKEELIVNVAAVDGDGRRFFGGFSNVKRDPSDDSRTVRSDEFGYVMTEFPEPMVFVNGSGTPQVVVGGHLDQMRQQLDVWPNKTLDHMKLLASVNRRVATALTKRDGHSTVSPHCHVSFLPITQRKEAVGGVVSRSFTERNESVPVVMPLITMGIDTSHLVERVMSDDLTPNIEDLNKTTERRP